MAIGVPTHERLFHDYIVKSGANVPVLYTWLEGYGIGGHAVLDLPNKKGCLRCAYVEPNTGIRGLASNLNFIESDQDIVKNYAGCGEMFIPYGAISSTQTALIATDLAVNYLDGRLAESTKCSWKGDSSDSEAEGLKLTPRYNFFESSLKRQLLRHPLCDVCNSDVPIVYQCDKLRICMPQSIYEQLLTYRQLESESPESAGLIIGYYRNNGDVWIDRLTLPKETDKRSRFSFKLDAQAHQSEVDEVYRSSDQILGYIGTWHTHPQAKPTPSGVDRLDWKDHEKDNPERPLFFVVVGLEKVSVYSFRQEKIIELSPLTKNR
ncbi:Mov34/MPN/PAD-1 family protein [Moritella viscosa]|uniref:Mov34/MPN/PAD-1 family protein n=1 Tax=Moritella viscosa TaxID=80854 RepID=UPI00091BD78D|nr:Mov34/MPN/PAD-1 family protein [Moritella viscosa]SHN99800.1 UBA/THIF-type NAD/FAD binding protein [Moritella viscosa]SHN99819.1 UBA/THIF-type NAD/FAD binding protein [Moritella viscosa]SHO02612.1 UBA/THIF-type NAD/FAD binding protein [Moritella viscosa]